jgi:hypothetical protein
MRLGITPVTHRPTPPLCFAAVADKFTGDSRLPAVCHVLEPLHRIAVNPCASPWLVGVTATVDATNSRALVLFFLLRPPRVPIEIPGHRH